MKPVPADNRTCGTCAAFEPELRECRTYPPTVGEALRWPLVAPDDWCDTWSAPMTAPAPPSRVLFPLTVLLVLALLAVVGWGMWALLTPREYGGGGGGLRLQIVPVPPVQDRIRG